MTETEIVRLFDRASEAQIVADAASSPDLERYRHHVAHLDIPEEHKTDMMLAVWRMMQNFVDRAFGDDPVQRSGCLAGNRHAVDEAPALPVIDCPTNAPADETLSDAFHQYANGANNQEKR